MSDNKPEPIMRRIRRSNSQASLGGMNGSPLSPLCSTNSSGRRVRLQDFGSPGSPGSPVTPVRLRRGRSNSMPNLNFQTNHWQLVANVILAASQLKKTGNTRRFANNQDYFKYIDDVSTCTKCGKQNIADTDWYRCNKCTHITHVDLCRYCFRNWNHPQHIFSEMSQSAFSQLHKRIKKRWYILRLAMVSNEIQPLIDKFHTKVIAHLIRLLTPSANEPTAGVLKEVFVWCLSIPHIKKILTQNKQTSLAAFHWKGEKAGFARPLTADAKQKLVHYLREQDLTGKVRVCISDSSSEVDLTDGAIKLPYDEGEAELIIAGGTSNTKLFCKFPKRDPFRVTKVLMTDTSKPNSLVILGPPKIQLQLKWGDSEQQQAEAISVLTTLRSLSRIFGNVCSIPESILVSRGGAGFSLRSKVGLQNVINRNLISGYRKTPQEIAATPLTTPKTPLIQHKEMWNSSSKVDDRHHRVASSTSTPAHLELIHFKNGSHSLWEDTTPAVLHVLRSMMNGLVDALRIVSNKKVVRTGTGFNAFEGLVPDNCQESTICKEVTEIVKNYGNGKKGAKTTSDSGTGTSTKNQSGQWDSLSGWEACHTTSRLRSGRVSFEKNDRICAATTRHDTVALGKQSILPSSVSTVVTYKILESSEETFVGLTPVSSGNTVFDHKAFPVVSSKGSNDQLHFNGIFFKGSGNMFVPGLSSEQISLCQTESQTLLSDGDVLKFRVKPSVKNGFVKVFKNGHLIFQQRKVSFPECGVAPYVLFRSSPKCRVELCEIESPQEGRKKLVTDPLSATPPAVLRMLRVMEGTFFNHFDRSLRRPPPRDQVTLVFTDVQSSTVLWDKSPDGMKVALALHNSVLRRLIEKWRGYEVKTEGDAFMIAFQRTEHALNWCLDSQRELMQINWPEELLEHPAASVVHSADGKVLFKGLRVRMGFHTGDPDCEQDPVTGRMDYFGPMVNLAARISGVGQGGETVIGGAAFRHLHRNGSLPDPEVHLYCHGSISLKGITRNENLFSLLPMELKDRVDYWERKDKTIQTVFETNTKKVQEVVQQALQQHKQPTAAGTATTSNINRHKSDLETNTTTPEVPGLTPLTSDNSLSSTDTEGKKSNWVRTVWRQAAKIQVGKEKESDSHQPAKKKKTSTTKTQTDDTLHVSTGSSSMHEATECLLMSMHEGQQVTLCDFNNDASRLNGSSGTIAGYEADMVFVETEKFGQISVHKSNLIKSSKKETTDAQTQTRILRSPRVSLIDHDYDQRIQTSVSTRSRGGSMGSTTSDISYQRSRKSKSPCDDSLRPVQRLLSDPLTCTTRSPRLGAKSPLTPITPSKEVNVLCFNADGSESEQHKTQTQQITELETHITTLKGNIKRLEDEIQSPSKDIPVLDQRHVQQLENENKSLRQRIKELTAGSGKVATLERRLSSSEDKLQEAGKHTALLKRSISDLQDKLAINKNHDNSTAEENRLLKEKIAEQDNTLRSLKRKTSSTLRRLEAEDECADLRRKNTSLTEDITNQSKEIISLQHIIKELKASTASKVVDTSYTETLESRVREFEAKEVSFKSQIETSKTTEASLDQLVASLRKQLAETTSKLSAKEEASTVKGCSNCDAVEVILKRVADVTKRESELAAAQQQFEELRTASMLTTTTNELEGLTPSASSRSLFNSDAADSDLRAKLSIASQSSCQNCLDLCAGFARLDSASQHRGSRDSSVSSIWQSGELGKSAYQFPSELSPPSGRTSSCSTPLTPINKKTRSSLGSQSSDHAFRMAAGGKVLPRKTATTTNLTISIPESRSPTVASPSVFVSHPSYSAVRNPAKINKRRPTR
eukprot:TRINITY_DN12731_c5_g1_i1.p1 TRINITY_DN12731_c5_g1~~TRINITY_DN12731_c5_g1_i1.p1  ORF type:complete len:1838 (+),score=324.93 TRINITY_DN12731_c5_g1_i1:79-5514(+)